MRFGVVLVTVAMALPCCAEPQAKREAIPFVGCPADGQAGYVAPPQEAPKVVGLGDVPAGRIAYYKGEQSPGVFAPRGWHCRVTYGSSGATLLITPAPIDSTRFPPQKVLSNAVEVGSLDGETSGRFGVAHYASRLFPKVAAKFIERVKSESLVPASDFELGPYASDSVTYLDSLTAEFTTPASKTGLGTEGRLDPSRDAVRGIAVLYNSDPREPDISILRVRLGANMHQVTDAILRLNRECMQKIGGC
jgi:hypothetical protein